MAASRRRESRCGRSRKDLQIGRRPDVTGYTPPRLMRRAFACFVIDSRARPRDHRLALSNLRRATSDIAWGSFHQSGANGCAAAARGSSPQCEIPWNLQARTRIDVPTLFGPRGVAQ
jgi:hypothetical protein